MAPGCGKMRAVTRRALRSFKGHHRPPPASRRTFHVGSAGLLPNAPRQARAAASIHDLFGPQRHDPTCRRIPPSPPGRGSRPARQGGTRRGPAPRRQARLCGAGPIRRGRETARPRPEPSGMPPRSRSNPVRGMRRGPVLSGPGAPPRSPLDLSRAGGGAALLRAFRAGRRSPGSTRHGRDAARPRPEPSAQPLRPRSDPLRARSPAPRRSEPSRFAVMPEA